MPSLFRVLRGPKTTCIANETSPKFLADNINGAWNVSSLTTKQPTSSPARIASSRNAAAGNITTPDTAWSANQPCILGDNRPVNTTPPEAGNSITPPSNACSLAFNPKPITLATTPSPES